MAANTPPVDVSIHPESTIELFPLNVSPEGREYLVGLRSTGSFLAVERPGLDAISMLAEGQCVSRVQDALAARYRADETDLTPLLERLVGAGFVQSIDGIPIRSDAEATAGGAPRLSGTRVEWLFGTRALIVYAAILAIGATALVTDPGVAPGLADVLRDARTSILSLLLAVCMVAKHELAHVLAARFLGVEARCRLGHRLVFPVIETDLSQLWVVERSRRHVALLAGPVSDLLAGAIAVTVLWLDRRQWVLLPPIAVESLSLIVFITACVVIWQLNPFLRTDTYYLLANLVGQRHLADDAKACLREWRGSWPPIVRAYAVGYAISVLGLSILAVLGIAGVVWLEMFSTAPPTGRSGLVGLAITATLVTLSLALQRRRRRASWRLVFSPRLRRTLPLVLAAALVWNRAPSARAEELTGPSYRIEVALDPNAATLAATETILFRNSQLQVIEELYLHLHANAYSHEGTAFARDRSELAFFENPMTATPSRASGGSIEVTSAQVDGASVRFVVDETILRIPLEQPLAPGGTARIAIGFVVHIPRFRDRLAAHDGNFVIGAWFPKMAVVDAKGWHASQRRGIGEFFSETGDYDVSITVPAGFVVGATGEPVERVTRTDGRETSRWQARRVRDFAWVADRAYHVTRTAWEGVSVTYLSFSHDEAAAESGLRTATAALDYFSRIYGRYPYPSLTLAEASAVPPGVGIEYPQLVIISDDLHRLTRFMTSHETVVVHEIAHQWWYGLVGNNEVDEAWLDEALATYSTRRFMRATYGQDLPMLRWPRALSFLPSPSESEVARAMYVSQARAGFDREVRRSSASFDDLQSYLVSVYYKGAFVLEMLEYLVGPDTFDRILRSYAERYAYANATSTGFIETAEGVSGRDLGAFFAQWLDGTATCDYSVDDVGTRRSAAGDESFIRVRRRGDAVMPVRVRVRFEDGRTEDQVWDGREREATLTVRSAGRIEAVHLDPDQHLLETDVVNNHYPRRWSVSANPLAMPADAYAVGVLPVAWYDRGLELGGVLAAGYPPEIGMPYGLRREHAISMAVLRNVERGGTRFGVSYSSPLDAFGPRGTFQAATWLQPGRERATATLEWWLGSRFYQAPAATIAVGALHERHDSTAILHERGPFDAGTVRALQGRFRFNRLATDYFPVRGGVLDVSVEGGWRDAGSDWSYARAVTRAELYRPLGSRAKVAINAVHGNTAGESPRQRAMRLTAEGGFLSEQLDQVWGRSLTSLATEVRLPMRESSVDAAGFVHLAHYWDRTPTTARGVFSEIGVGLRLFDNAPFAVQIDWPFWVDGPSVAGSPGFRARQVSIRFGRVFEGRDR